MLNSVSPEDTGGMTVVNGFSAVLLHNISSGEHQSFKVIWDGLWIHQQRLVCVQELYKYIHIHETCRGSEIHCEAKTAKE